MWQRLHEKQTRAAELREKRRAAAKRREEKQAAVKLEAAKHAAAEREAYKAAMAAAAAAAALPAASPLPAAAAAAVAHNPWWLLAAPAPAPAPEVAAAAAVVLVPAAYPLACCRQKPSAEKQDLDLPALPYGASGTGPSYPLFLGKALYVRAAQRAKLAAGTMSSRSAHRPSPKVTPRCSTKGTPRTV